MNTELWTAYEAAAATGGMLCARGGVDDGAELPEESWAARGISIDTRTLQPGEIFVALQDVRDGHDFVETAFKAGASAALVSRAPDDTPDNAPLLMVGDTLRGLEALASAARDRCFGKFIAVTGSVGKTSTKEMLRTALAPCGQVHAADKSFNNHLGVPLTLAALPSNADFGVFEIGMNHAGEITPLTNLVKPHIAIVTTVAPAHLEFFASVEEIAEAKAEIFNGVRRGGSVVLPIDNEYFDLLAKRAKQNAGKGEGVNVITFGETDGADLRMLDYQLLNDGSAQITASIFGKINTFKFGMPGQHQAMNALAVLGAVHAAGADMAQAKSALAAMKPVQGRGLFEDLQINGHECRLVDESYNANPASMSAAIKSLRLTKADGKKIVILGEMKELGDEGPDLHMALAPELIEAKIDLVFAAGSLMAPMIKALPKDMQGGWAENAIELSEKLIPSIQGGDIIMAKGSNASRVSALVQKLQEEAGR